MLTRLKDQQLVARSISLRDRRRRTQGETQLRTRTPRSLNCSKSDGTARSNDQLTDDGQSQTCTPRVTTPSVIEPREALENALPIFPCDAWAVVADADHRRTLINSGSYFHLRPRVTHRIVNQIPHRTMQLAGLDHDHHRLVRDECDWDSRTCVRPSHVGKKFTCIDTGQPRRWFGVGVGTCQKQQTGMV